jgi:hypothetical protein
MASTYSSLKIELIGTGDQSGTWGTTTNNNLGDAALGEAITGSADVAFSSADVTVTLTDTNATQAARNLRLNLTGTTGGARSLILGSGCQIEKLYLINNTCADAITVKNTTGTGIAVAAGKSMFVYNNGTNVVDAVTQFNGTISLTSGVTGTLPIANGGTGTTSTTFTNLTTNVTGTLPIANGGTGTTSTTFVNAATNVTGTLPVANGGTGATTQTAYAVLAGGTTSTGAYQSIASVGTSGQVLTSNGAGALPTFQAAAGGFPAGTRMSFQQTTAPTGWTKDTTAAINDSMLRLVTGSASSGGTTAFSTWSAVTTTGATTLDTTQIPSHTHLYSVYGGAAGASSFQMCYGSGFGDVATGATGGGGSHTHSLTRSLKYYDFIIAAKD